MNGVSFKVSTVRRKSRAAGLRCGFQVDSPMVVLVDGCLEQVERMFRAGYCIRGESDQCGLGYSRHCNDYKSKLSLATKIDSDCAVRLMFGLSLWA